MKRVLSAALANILTEKVLESTEPPKAPPNVVIWVPVLVSSISLSEIIAASTPF
jgi:hypothetical protein